MSAGLKGIRLAVIGGDERELYFIPEMQKLGAHIIGAGFEKADPIPGMRLAAQQEAIREADVLIFPLYGADERGLIKARYGNEPIVLNQEMLQAIPNNRPLFIGWVRPTLKAAADKMGIRIIETAKLDEVAILNSVPSAEGAIQMAMQHTRITLHGSRSYVLGLGRTGWTLAAMLKGLGARVTGVARKTQDLARALTLGLTPLPFSELERAIGQAEVIFNTVPSLVLDKELLEKTSRDAVIIDVASMPGGTDFEYAQMLGIKALLAPGLPGMAAPKTAGMILAQVYPRLILRYLTAPMTSVE
ncbi:MAG: dipicolinate synthase subunit DpsA [Peptococcaceae bacterium]|jgi:dipicolinate synthase subunit A|nr:dipicolinate synthase subunit DpsA [Peptococcaceae bacterium]